MRLELVLSAEFPRAQVTLEPHKVRLLDLVPQHVPPQVITAVKRLTAVRANVRLWNGNGVLGVASSVLKQIAGGHEAKRAILEVTLEGLVTGVSPNVTSQISGG